MYYLLISQCDRCKIVVACKMEPKSIIIAVLWVKFVKAQITVEVRSMRHIAKYKS